MHFIHASVYILRLESGDGVETLLGAAGGGEVEAAGVHSREKERMEGTKGIDEEN